VVGEHDRAVRRRQPGGVEEILDRERNAVLRDRVRSREEDAVEIGQAIAR
jgi:hypothetical protein